MTTQAETGFRRQSQGSHQKLEEARKDPLREPWQERGPADTLLWVYGLQNRERTHFCCFQPPILWSLLWQPREPTTVTQGWATSLYSQSFKVKSFLTLALNSTPTTSRRSAFSSWLSPHMAERRSRRLSYHAHSLTGLVLLLSLFH